VRPARELALVAPADPSAPPGETLLLGLPIVRRTALAAKRAGFDGVLVSGATAEIRRALAGAPAECLASGAPVPAEARTLPWNVVLRTEDLKRLASGDPGVGLGVALHAPEDFERAESLLLSALLKDTEGFMSRHFERKLSLAISRRLARTRVTPNVMTFVSVAVGLIAAPFFVSSRPLWQTIGACLFLLHSILDGCDGELARLKFQESRFGGVLDFWGDNVVHSAIFGAIAVGWTLAIGAGWPLVLGVLAIGGTLASAGLVYQETMTGPKEGPLFTSVAPLDTRLARAADALSRRDFIYVVLALSLFGKADWFLAVSAIGTPAFFLLLAALSRRRAERKTT
jgi:1L-myo-inositol 1-phosphate cytidylyltransferase / CDP-L-myo-inositol myo-inositolphosphotransferase